MKPAKRGVRWREKRVLPDRGKVVYLHGMIVVDQHERPVVSVSSDPSRFDNPATMTVTVRVRDIAGQDHEVTRFVRHRLDVTFDAQEMFRAAESAVWRPEECPTEAERAAYAVWSALYRMGG